MPRKSGKKWKKQKPDVRNYDATFREHYLRTGNAYQAALAAGDTPKNAKAHSFEKARAIRVQIADALRARGLDEVSQAKKLSELQGKRDLRIQLEATKEINRLLDAYPAPKDVGDSSRPIQLIFPASFSSLIVKAKEA